MSSKHKHLAFTLASVVAPVAAEHDPVFGCCVRGACMILDLPDAGALGSLLAPLSMLAMAVSLVRLVRSGLGLGERADTAGPGSAPAGQDNG